MIIEDGIWVFFGIPGFSLIFNEYPVCEIREGNQLNVTVKFNGLKGSMQ